MLTKKAQQYREKARKYDAALKRISQRKKEQQGGGRQGTSQIESTKSRVLGRAPNVSTGERVMGSRGYSFARLAGYLTKQFSADQAKHELGISRKLQEAMRQCPGYKSTTDAVMAPLSPDLLQSEGEQIISDEFANSMKQMLMAGVQGADQDQYNYLVQRYGRDTIEKNGFSYSDVEKVGGSNQSWIQANQGGALVPYPQYGPLVALLRNKASVLLAGAQIFPLPPQGRIGFPRQTTPTQAFHVNEGRPITNTVVGTDQLVLSAKKTGVLVNINNDLLRFAGPIIEQMIRNDSMTTLGLQLDFDILQGIGSDNVIQGIIGYPGVPALVPQVPANIQANGNLIGPGDIFQMLSQIEENNGEVTGFIMRPRMFYTLEAYRAASVAANDQQGLYLFNPFSAISEKAVSTIKGVPVFRSNNVPANRVKGASGNTLTVVYAGQWSDMMIGIYGAVEFATATQGDTAFPSDFSQIRAIMNSDSGPLHSGIFTYLDQLVANQVGA